MSPQDKFREREKYTNFGFETIESSKKAGLVNNIFDSVATRYDIMNDIMSLGVHRLWKTYLIRKLNPKKNMRMIDIGGGTGDIAIKFINKGGKNVTVADINNKMLNTGRNRAIDSGVVNGIDWVNCDAENLSFQSSSFDVYITAFCLRNVTNLDLALNEAYRILKPGGRFLCLEFSHVGLPILSEIYDKYSFNIVPLIGKIIADDKAAYQYLVESIRRFPEQSDFAQLIGQAGLDIVKYENITCGIVAIHSAWKT